ncbi:S1 RNA-binding domain-containing protein [Desulfoluna butyratoxydans]|uniref:Small ribosomal subunit protein bS1 n=1 Tax=Desulfoluna butyratoxydans TaxID=231438 RepID=A0A4U8YT61_9BACT|nr:S1 RNA-binding domain-containing protein [Desulfoluna butyratoxydans]VFQ47111.1 nucleic acid-binding ob-fold [Desulfoluna butyratoxydans]
MNNENQWEAISLRYPEGQKVRGRVTQLQPYGCLVELEDGVKGLLHATDLHWTDKTLRPADMLSQGDLVDVMVLRVNTESGAIALGLKQCGENPWEDLAARCPEGSRVRGRVTRIVDYGCFVEIEDRFEGIVYVSEMDWTNTNIHPSNVVQVGDTIEVMVLDVNAHKGSFSLSLKQCHPNPWEQFAETHKKGDRVRGTLSSVSNIGLFVTLEGGVTGLTFYSDSPYENGEEAISHLTEGDDIDAVVLSIDAERERICLGISLPCKDDNR